MVDWAFALLASSGKALWQALLALSLPAAFFLVLALFAKGRQALIDARRALPETRTTLVIMGVNIVLVVPGLALLATWMDQLFRGSGWHLVPPDVWGWLPAPLVILVAVFAGDFAGYWRHRIEHTRLLWPSHAVHHSDTEMTWLALERFHPINRLTTLALDNAFLLALGFPAYAVIANNVVRHYYGFFIHADLPWTYGWWGRILVSPAMHRWHHAADPVAYNTNYATVFALFDRWFGTYRVPGPCTAPLGVTDEMGKGALGQLAYPFRAAAYRRDPETR